jgi:hypothetical protein
MGERAVRTDLNTWTLNENLSGIFTSVCTDASTPHVLGGMYARLHRASNPDCTFAQVQRFESDMQMHLVVIKFETGLGWVRSYLLSVTQTSDEGCGNLDLELCKIHVGVSPLTREWSINLTRRDGTALNTENSYNLSSPQIKHEWAHGQWAVIAPR